MSPSTISTRSRPTMGNPWAGYTRSTPTASMSRMAAAHSMGYRWTFWGFPALGNTHVAKSPVQAVRRSASQPQA